MNNKPKNNNGTSSSRNGGNGSGGGRKKSTLFIIRMGLLGACLGWFTKKYFISILLPYGVAYKSDWNDRPTYSSIDYKNDLLREKYGKLHKIYERMEPGNDNKQQQQKLLKGPETIFFDKEGTMYTINDDAYLIRLTDFQMEEDDEEIVKNIDDKNNDKVTEEKKKKQQQQRTRNRMTAKTSIVADVGAGRPLGAAFSLHDDTLYMADAILGLTRIKNFTSATTAAANENENINHVKVEIVASSVLIDDTNTGTNKQQRQRQQYSRIAFADDLAIGPKTGKVYFTDASEISPQRSADFFWDIMYASKLEALRGPSGRVLCYDPTTEKVEVLVTGLHFANGLAIDVTESYLLFVETFRMRIGKLYLSGDKQGTVEYVVDGKPLAGYIDGIDCGWKGINGDTTYCYTVCPTAVVPVHKLLLILPDPFDRIVRTLLLMLPKSLAPPVETYGCVAVIDADESEFVDMIQDPNGQDLGHSTGMTIHNNKLYLGSLENDFIAVYDL